MKAPVLTSCALLALAPLGLGAYQDRPASELERAFPQGGRVHLELAAGEYDVHGSAKDAIRVQWRTRKPEDAARARAEVTVRGTDATIRTYGPKNGFKVDIALPVRTDIDLDLSAGELSVIDIEGNKDVSVWAGEVRVAVGDAKLYRTVDAAVRVGDLEAEPFAVNTGGLFRSLNRTSSGQYTLRARLFAGELRLVK